MLSTLAKKTTEPAVSEFEAAEARWKEFRDKDRELIEREEGLKLALASSSSSGIDDRMPQHLRDRAEQIAQGVRRPQELNALLERVHDEIADFKPKLSEEYETYQAARRRETNRLAGELQPRHRSAVKAMAKALEALSLAMTEEIDTRAELVRVAPEHLSSKLPDCSTGLLVGTLADWNSPASEWARAMRKLTILE